MSTDWEELGGVFASSDADHPEEENSWVHKLRKGVVCNTERRGSAAGSHARIVLDATAGYIPLWERGTILRWRFQERAFRRFAKPEAAKTLVADLFAAAVLEWKDAAPVRFKHDDDLWDFELTVAPRKDCDVSGCVLASAFFPDGGRHELTVYPSMFEQNAQEQLETLIHEVGHIFGLRHFFALEKERAWPSVVFGKHDKFSIMNYGGASMLVPSDLDDLKRLYELAWSKKLTQINGTPIKLVQPYSVAGRIPAAAAASYA